MKDFAGVLELQVESIVANLRHLQEDRSGRLLRQAESRARELKRSARRRLRAHGSEAVRDARARREKALQMAKHRLHAEAGNRMQARHAAVLREGWPALVAELERRWSDSATRREWCDAIVAKALGAIGQAAWTIEHPSSWTDADSDHVCRKLKKLDVPAATFNLDESATAGMRIRSGTACLDGTIDGLLAERTRVEGLLLAAWEHLEPERGHEQDD
jgi:hypothetical protein